MPHVRSRKGPFGGISFIQKVQKASRQLGTILTSSQAGVIAESVGNIAESTGSPKATILAMGVAALLPLVGQALKIFGGPPKKSPITKGIIQSIKAGPKSSPQELLKLLQSKKGGIIVIPGVVNAPFKPAKRRVKPKRKGGVLVSTGKSFKF